MEEKSKSKEKERGKRMKRKAKSAQSQVCWAAAGQKLCICCPGSTGDSNGMQACSSLITLKGPFHPALSSVTHTHTHTHTHTASFPACGHRSPPDRQPQRIEQEKPFR